MAILMDEVRRAVMVALGKTKDLPAASNPWYYTLPKDVSTHPGFIRYEQDRRTYRIKVLSSAEAALLKPRSHRPHRIFIWHELCSRWIPGGKFVQHSKFCKEEK